MDYGISSVISITYFSLKIKKNTIILITHKKFYVKPSSSHYIAIKVLFFFLIFKYIFFCMSAWFIFRFVGRSRGGVILNGSFCVFVRICAFIKITLKILLWIYGDLRWFSFTFSWNLLKRPKKKNVEREMCCYTFFTYFVCISHCCYYYTMETVSRSDSYICRWTDWPIFYSINHV